MNNFLNNILSRHRVQATDDLTPNIVEPRLKSRFEADSGVEQPSLVEHETDWGSPEAIGKPAYSPDKRSTAQHDLPMTSPLSDHSSGVREDPPASLISTPGKDGPQTDVASGKRQTGHETRSGTQAVTMPLAGSDSREQLQTDDRQNVRVRTFLEDLNDMTGPNSDHQLPSLSPRTGVSSDAVISPPAAEEEPPIETALETDSPDMEWSEPDDPGTNPVTPGSLQSPGFQTPQWVAEIGSDLKRRLGAFKAQEPAEPVINVSIGRVEIRASGETASRQTATAKKPGGIMSLDDYLENRNRRQV